MDTINPVRRSENMRRIKNRHTAPELSVRRLAHRLGYRFRLHRKDLPGCPDLVFPARKSVIFVHGCFWHQHQNCHDGRPPRSRGDYWIPKLKRNQVRDKKVLLELKRAGWRVLVLWECECKDQAAVAKRVVRFLGK